MFQEESIMSIHDNLLNLFIRSELNHNKSSANPKSDDQLILHIINQLIEQEGIESKTPKSSNEKPLPISTAPEAYTCTKDLKVELKEPYTSHCIKELNPFYVITYFDYIDCKIRINQTQQFKKICYAIGIDLQGRRNLLATEIIETISYYAWRNLLATIKVNGTDAIIIACYNNTFAGLYDAINDVYPETIRQIHLAPVIKYMEKYVASSNIQLFNDDIKTIFAAANVLKAETDYSIFNDRWAKDCPLAVRYLNTHWNEICTIFTIPNDIRSCFMKSTITEPINQQISYQMNKTGIAASDEAAINTFEHFAKSAISNRSLWNWKSGMLPVILDRYRDIIYKYEISINP